MNEIAISKFKAECLSILETVRKTRQPVRVTKFGKPIADVIPPKAIPTKGWVGCMKGSVEEIGDIVGPVGAFGSWERRSR
jgi:prevent-host-death family protein